MTAVKLEFNLPQEQEEYEAAYNGIKWKNLVEKLNDQLGRIGKKKLKKLLKDNDLTLNDGTEYLVHK